MDTVDLYVKNPMKKLQIREAARLLSISPMTARSKLEELVKLKTLTKTKDGLYPSFRLNHDSKEIKLELSNRLIKRLYSSGLVDEIKKTHPEAIVLFGSVARGEFTEKSDIDLFVITESKSRINVNT